MVKGKTVIFGEESRQKTLEGVNILANAVKSTLGPRGRNVAIEIKESQAPIITKDGVTVARHIVLNDHSQNMGAQLVKSVASAANNSAGDGTTTATVLAQSIYSNGLRMVVSGYNPVLINRGITKAVASVLEELDRVALKIDGEKTLSYVARISANNDDELGDLISEAVTAIGEFGVLTVEEDSNAKTRVEYTDGLKFDKGFLHYEFVNNNAKLSCDYTNALCLIADYKIESIHEVAHILKEVSESQTPIIFVVKDMEHSTIEQIVYNHMNRAIKANVIKAPGFGDHRSAFLKDLALLVGGKVIYSKMEMEKINSKMLGVIGSISTTLNSTTILNGRGNKEEISKTKEELKEQLQSGTLYEDQAEIVASRIARLSGGAAIFKVGGKSEAELREKRDRVEDAINAVRSAIDSGIVPGGGTALIKASKVLDPLIKTLTMQEEIVGVEIVKKSLLEPFIQIMKNAGVDSASIYIERIKNSDFSGYDALKLEFVENMIDAGIIDPVKVVKSSLEHAASASGVLLTTEVMIFNSEQ